MISNAKWALLLIVQVALMLHRSMVVFQDKWSDPHGVDSNGLLN